MEKLQNLLSIDDDKSSNKLLLIYILVAYFFSIAVRYYWIYIFQGDPNSFWNGELMINTNDGYAWAEGARDILSGGNDKYDQSAVTQPISIITATLASLLPIKFETLILWMPAIFGSLLTLPIVLIGHTLKQTKVGFVAALLASIAWSYYNRTMIGYYDTDLLVIVLPTFVLWGVVLSLYENKNRYLLLTALFIIFYRWYYGGSYSLLLGMTLGVLLFSVVFDRKNLFNYKLVLFMLASAYLNSFSEKIIAVALLFVLFHFGKERAEKAILPLLGIVVLYMLFNGALTPIIMKLEQYVLREAVANDMQLKFFNVIQTVREAGGISFEMFVNRISGHIITFVLSVIGLIMLIVRYPIMLVSMPMVALGFLAYKNGLRFTVYAVPIMALGVSFLIFYAGSFLKGYGRYAFISLCTVGILYPNITHVIAYKVPTVFSKAEVEVVDNLGKVADNEDYVITWWDYGFPIRYYSNTKTLVDGGKHDGFQNFVPSLVLNTPNQKFAAQMARLEVEYTEKQMRERLTGKTISLMLKDYGASDPMVFFNNLVNKDLPLPEKTRDIYLYLPKRMLNIFPTVSLFSNLDIRTGERYNRKYFSSNTYFKQVGRNIQLGDGSVILQDKGLIVLGGNQQIPIKSFYTVSYNKQQKIVKSEKRINPKGLLNIVYLPSYQMMLVMDDAMLNSTFLQLFIFENYNPEYFELVNASPYAKVYKLKI